jgi:Ca2+-transporting ATPase
MPNSDAVPPGKKTNPSSGPAAETEWHALETEEVLRRLQTASDGLPQPEVERRLASLGPNDLPRGKPVSAARIFLRQFSNFFVLILLLAAGLAFSVSFLPGESGRRLTAAFILGIVLLTVLLSFYQEYRAQKEIRGMENLLEDRTVVMRGGIRCTIPTVEVVPGDILILSQGQKLPADGRILESRALRADESALTGESLPADKSAAAVPPGTPLAERSDMLFRGTFLVNGTGTAAAVETGARTQIGSIAAALGRMAQRPTPFQVEIGRMSRQMMILIGALAALVAAILLLLLHESPVDVALNAVSLAVATVPESLPVVLAFALALGARRMADRKALIRRLSVVESLGSVDIICTDKTGTLTRNLMTVRRIFAEGQLLRFPPAEELSPAARELLRAGILCNGASVETLGDSSPQGDPVDLAMLSAAAETGWDIEKERSDYSKTDEIPFSAERRMMTTVHRRGGTLVAFTKGGPGRVVRRCSMELRGGKEIPLDEDARASLRKTVEDLENDGFYVLAFARRFHPAAFRAEHAEEDMCFLGLQALFNPPHAEAAGAIARAHGAGIRVIMITGDSLLAARAVGRRLGLGDRGEEARNLEGLPPEELRKRMQDLDIVARATPQTKQKILSALEESGHFVAMTGDGVNDTIALRQADVGIAMGLHGTDIAKESSDMILLDDNFATIISAVEEGRRIFDNIRKFTNYLLSTSLGEVFVVLALSVAGFFPLSPRMLLWVNVVTDLVPASALAADPAVPAIMRRRPRRQNEPILNAALYATIAGSVVRTFFAYGFLFLVGLRLGGLEYARTMLFTSIVLHAFTRILVVRQLDNLSWRSNPALLWSYFAAVGLQLLALYTPLRGLFEVVPLDLRAWAVMVPTVALSSTVGVFMTRWILRILPLWREETGHGSSLTADRHSSNASRA